MINEEWDPEKEKDPEKMQQEILSIGKEMLESLKAEQEKKKKDEEKFAQELAAQVGAHAPQMLKAFAPPTFEEVSAKLKKAWGETKKIAPDADGMVQVEILRALLHASWESPEQAI